MFRLACISIFIPLFAIAQKPISKGWHLLDAAKDGYHGISLQQAMDLLKTRGQKPVIVAVMDGGVDTNQLSLCNVLWNNTKEIVGNKIDDDNNGYVDDAHGWNFLGNANGQNVCKESQEAVRIYHELKPQFENKLFDSLNANTPEKKQYNLWLQSNKLLEFKPEQKMSLLMVEVSLKANKYYDSIIRVEMNLPEYTADDLETFVPPTKTGKLAKLGYLRFLNLLDMDRDKTNKQLFDDLESYIDQQKQIQFGKQAPVKNYRNDIIGDDENNFYQTQYGNADIMCSTSLHGTHVSGIIAGQPSYTQKFTGGVCPTAKIMTIRCVPDGDEHDKDVALGIMYAVNNGAKIINMSFGKEVSPHKDWIDDAIRFAAKHDVLIVHAAGNDAKNLNDNPDYPTPVFQNNELASNVITVGASGDSSLNCGILADFTNYGSLVDVLAPGVKIFSAMPNNQYGYQQGTSMAAPIVSGIAALLRSYFPRLSALQVKYIIENSTDNHLVNQRFKKPGGQKKETIRMKDVCKTGGIVNAYNAVKMAIELSDANH